jgi:hypothetical protein
LLTAHGTDVSSIRIPVAVLRCLIVNRRSLVSVVRGQIPVIASLVRTAAGISNLSHIISSHYHQNTVDPFAATTPDAEASGGRLRADRHPRRPVSACSH